jgi:hypothetical protein
MRDVKRNPFAVFTYTSWYPPGGRSGRQPNAGQYGASSSLLLATPTGSERQQ